MTKKALPIDLLVLDAGTQSRLSIHDETVIAYAELIEDSGTEWPFPPVDVFTDGNRYMIADGFHRVLGATKTKRSSIPCIVHKGTATDARIFAMTANDTHGLRMTQADKRACVEWLLDNQPKMTQKLVSDAAGVAERTVRRIVAERKHNRTLSYSGEDGRTDSDGTEPQEETAPQPAEDGTELAGEVEGADNTEWEEVDESQYVDFTPPAKAPATEPAKPDPAKAKNLANQYRDRLVRAIDDYHELAPNRAERDRLVKVVQGVELW